MPDALWHVNAYVTWAPFGEHGGEKLRIVWSGLRAKGRGGVVDGGWGMGWRLSL